MSRWLPLALVAVLLCLVGAGLLLVRRSWYAGQDVRHACLSECMEALRALPREADAPVYPVLGCAELCRKRVVRRTR